VTFFFSKLAPDPVASGIALLSLGFSGYALWSSSEREECLLLRTSIAGLHSQASLLEMMHRFPHHAPVVEGAVDGGLKVQESKLRAALDEHAQLVKHWNAGWFWKDSISVPTQEELNKVNEDIAEWRLEKKNMEISATTETNTFKANSGRSVATAGFPFKAGEFVGPHTQAIDAACGSIS